MSEARQRNMPREVSAAPQGDAGDNLASRLAEYGRSYIGRCGGYCYPLQGYPGAEIGVPMTAEHVALLHWAQMDQGAQQAERDLKKPENAKLSDAQKVALITKTVREWKPGPKLLKAFQENVLHLAADMIAYELLAADPKGRRVEATYAAERKAASDRARVAREKAVQTILMIPDRADKYQARVVAKINALYAERYVPVKRSKSETATTDETDDEIET